MGFYEAAKTRGWRVSVLIVSLLLFRLKGLNIYSGHQSMSFLPKIDDNTFYRLMNNSWMNWRGLLYSFAKQFKRNVEEKGESSTGPKCFVVDDSDLEKTGKPFEFIGRIFNHITRNYVLGFILSKKQAKNRFNKTRNKKSNGAKRVKELDMKKTNNYISMIKRAIKNGFIADYVLMDSWFVNDTIYTLCRIL